MNAASMALKGVSCRPARTSANGAAELRLPSMSGMPGAGTKAQATAPAGPGLIGTTAENLSG
jgi:hypothetical protein